MSAACPQVGELDRSQTEILRRLEEIRAPGKRKLVAVVYCVYGDESHDEARARVFAVAGVFGRQEEWDELEVAWLERTRGKVFHAADCDSDAGDYAGTAHGENKRLYSDLIRLVANSKLLGHGVALNLEDYRRTFPSDFAQEPYYWEFGDVVICCTELAHLSIPQEEVKFTFDQAIEHEYNAASLYRYIANRVDLKFQKYFAGEVQFACRKTVGIQVADLVARETMKHLDNQIGPVKRPIRLSMRALAGTNRFRFVFYGSEHFQDLRNRIANMWLPGATLTEYRGWLSRLGLTDCMTNRIRYLRVIDETKEQR